jgi:polyhydroxybutyrate depolymerase
LVKTIVEYIMKLNKAYLLVLVVLLFTACKKDEVQQSQPVADSPAESRNLTLSSGGNVRNFTVHLPAGYNNASNLPLAFVLHGGQGSAANMLTLTDFRNLANQDKWLLIYPDGYQSSWNDGRPTAANQANINDVQFFSDMIDYAVINFKANAKKIYATGISNGGFMSARLGCELSNKITAIATVAASLPQALNCTPNNPVPTICIQGTLDALVPFLGGTVSPGAGGIALSHSQAVDVWKTNNNCGAAAVSTNVINNDPNDGTSITERKYVNANNGVEVVSYIVTGGGHTWPQGSQYLPESIIGKTSQDMNANQTIWSFFKKYSK